MSGNLQEIKKYIDCIDFSQLTEKMIHYNGWLREDAEETCLQYRRFLFLNRKYCTQETGALVPSEDIDEFWHAHILNTKAYMKDCDAIFGRYLHHYPFFGIDEASDISALYRKLEKTAQLYLKEFNEPLVATRSKYPRIVYFILKIFFDRSDKKTRNKYAVRERPRM